MRILKAIWKKWTELWDRIIPERIRPIVEAVAALLLVFGCLVGSDASVFVSLVIALAVAAGVWWWYKRKSERPEVK